MFTLTYNNLEKSLADWGICVDLHFRWASKDVDVVTFRTTEDFDPANGPQFAYKSLVKIWQGRTQPGAGGTLWFSGYIADIQRSGEGAKQNIVYQLKNVWWLLEREQFKQHTRVFAGWDPSPYQPGVSVAKYQEQVVSEVYLGETVEGYYQTNGAQVTEILAWANETYNPTRRGSTGAHDEARDVVKIIPAKIGVAVNTPKSRVNSIACAQAIASILRYSPDAVVAFDYSSSPPSLGVTPLAQMPELTVHLTQDQVEAIHAAPRYDRQLPGVYIQYRKTTTVDGAVYPALYTDKYPPEITEFTPELSAHLIELSAAQANHVRSAVVVEPLDTADGPIRGSAAARRLWWVGDPAAGVPAKDATLGEPNIDPDSIVIDAASVVNDRGASIVVANYPNILDAGSHLADWMQGIRALRATIKAVAHFTRYADAARLQPHPEKIAKEIHIQVTLTNAVTQTYSATEYFDPGEAVPPLYPAPGSLAKSVYDSLSTLQYSGTLALTRENFGDLAAIRPGVKLKLIGPRNPLNNCIVQSVEGQSHYGKITVQFGPSGVLDAEELLELRRISSARVIYRMPSNRASGGNAASGSVTFPNQGGLINNSHAQPAAQVYTASLPQAPGQPHVQIVADPQHILDGAGGHLPAGNRVAKMREISGCDSGAGQVYWMVMATEHYTR